MCRSAEGTQTVMAAVAVPIVKEKPDISGLAYRGKYCPSITIQGLTTLGDNFDNCARMGGLQEGYAGWNFFDSSQPRSSATHEQSSSFPALE